MMARSFRRMRRLAGKSISITAAICVLVGTTYVPIPGGVHKDLTVAFPCQGEACDCRSAAECWASCCCHSDAEKLAWAKKNGVLPPDWFIDGLRMSNHDLVTAIDQKCCTTAAPTCCSSRSKPASTASCCASKRPQENSAEVKTDGNQRTQPMPVCVKQQRKCQGQDGVLHLELLFVTLAEASVDTVHPQPRYRLIDVPTHSLEISPPTPPPQRA